MSLTENPSPLLLFFLFVCLGSVTSFYSSECCERVLRDWTGKRYFITSSTLQTVCFFNTEYLTPSFSLITPHSELNSFWMKKKKNKYCSIHYICSRMNVTCILLKPKLILPDNARVAVYQVCTTWEKKRQSNV